MSVTNHKPVQAPPEGRPPQGTGAMPWRGWFLRGLASAGTVAILLGIFAAGFAAERGPATNTPPVAQ